MPIISGTIIATTAIIATMVITDRIIAGTLTATRIAAVVAAPPVSLLAEWEEDSWDMLSLAVLPVH